MTASALYDGTVRHRRFAVREHRFSYRLHLAYLDLDELPELLGGRLVARRSGAVRFRRADYLGDPDRPLAETVRDLVAQRTGLRPGGPVRMLASLRALGHCFNPVSFYYCFSADGAHVEAVLAEVTNTPWGERHAYVLRRDAGDAGGVGAVLRGHMSKQLHVSPFMGMDHGYEWRLTEPGERLQVHIASHRAGATAFDATLSLRRRELTAGRLALAAVRQPALSLTVLARIYRQALLLKLKGVPVHPHPRAAHR